MSFFLVSNFFYLFLLSFVLFCFKIFGGVIVCGPIIPCDGIGRHSTEYHKFFLHNFIESRLQNSENFCFAKESGPSRWFLLKKNSNKTPEIFYFTGCLSNKYEKLFERYSQDNKIMISLTMFESTKAPDHYVKLLNKYFDVAIVPDFFLKKIYIDSGVKIPIFVIPLMLDFSLFLNSEIKTTRNYPFVFGNLSSITPRKQQLLLVQSFHELYGNNNDFKLIINGRYHDVDYLNKINNYIIENKIENIEISSNALDAIDYLNTFKKIDCYVSLSMGEGFSIQPREAMALGIPCIVSDNTAQTTICESGLVIPVSSVQLVDCVYKVPLEFGNLGYQFNTTKEDSKKALQTMVGNYDSYLGLSIRARDWVKQYTFTEFNKEMILSLFNPKEVILCEENKIEDGVVYINNAKTVKKYNLRKKIKK